MKPPGGGPGGRASGSKKENPRGLPGALYYY